MLNKEKCTKLLNHVIYLVGYGFGELNYWNIVGYILMSIDAGAQEVISTQVWVSRYETYRFSVGLRVVNGHPGFWASQKVNRKRSRMGRM